METLFQQTWKAFLQVMELVAELADGKCTYSEFQRRLKERLDELGRDVCRSVIEGADQRLREERKEREGWVIARRNDDKEFLSPFGVIRYQRTYFKHRQSGAYCYLADEVVGLGPHERIDPLLRAQLAERAVEMPYGKAGRWSETEAWHVSRQTVMKAVRKVRLPEKKSPSQEAKRRVRYLFIEADEDHVPRQKGKPRWQPRLVYVHEGHEQGSTDRPRLRHVRYFGGLYQGCVQTLWEEVWRYLDGHYDLEAVEVIFVSGDGASWIRRACELIPKTVFVLDRYHANKVVTAAAGADQGLYSTLWQALERADRKALDQALREVFQRAETDARRRQIVKAQRYLHRQWDGIVAWRRYRGIWPGCSAEAHVSHVYSDRMSSRPRAWSRTGVDQMARLRVFQANGGSVVQACLQGSIPLALKVSRSWLEQARRSIQQGYALPDEVFDNLPALRGRRSMLTRALRGLSLGVAI